MNTIDLYEIIDKENIHFIKRKLSNSAGMIVNYKDITAIVLDTSKIKGTIEENTVLIQELGHYYAGAYYQTNSPFDLIEKMEYKADKKAWEKFFPYPTIKELMKKGLTTVSELAEYFNVEAPYMARCINYYYKKYGFDN